MADDDRAHEPDADLSEDPERPVGAPDPREQVRKGKDPGWPVPGFPGPPTQLDSPASDADAPAPPG
jgi:hypothetical protein